MDWVKQLTASAGQRDGWGNDFPLDPNLPEALSVDLSELREPIHPMLMLRLAIFREWHAALGRVVDVVPPDDRPTRAVIDAFGVAAGDGRVDGDVILPVTRMTEFSEVEEIAAGVREHLEYVAQDVSRYGAPAWMAVSELTNNAVEHGANRLGSYAAVRRMSEGDDRQVAVAIADLGIGIPEHVRQQHPEWSDDSYAIARATDLSVSGTGRPDRGVGFDAVFDAALIQSTQEAHITIISANGFYRARLYDGRRKPEAFPTPRYRKGTWITCNFLSV